MAKNIVITGASSGFGAMTARALADAGHIVYAGMRDTRGRNAKAAAELQAYADEHNVSLQGVEMDVASQSSVDAAIAHILAEAGHLDVVVHNAGHMVLGPVEAFTVEQIADI
jgi:NAD(P)-dependent dehydrogenase (short-subunit alcohol dehydrogenase family)